MKKAILKSIAFYPLSKFAAVLSWFASPIVALFIYKEPRTDLVKRHGKQIETFDREYISKRLSWFRTHDNAADEWWYGVYNEDFPLKRVREWTQENYDNSKVVRYLCRVFWLCRNPAYTFSHNVLGFERGENYYTKITQVGSKEGWYIFEIKVFVAADDSKAFNIEGRINLPGPKYWNVNFGWKAHKGFSRLMYASRLFKLKDKE